MEFYRLRKGSKGTTMRILFITFLVGLTYGFPDPEDGSQFKKTQNLSLTPELGSGGGQIFDDDEDYNYIDEQLRPSTPRIPDLPTPTPTFGYDFDLIIPSETLAISSTPTPTPSLPVLPQSTLTSSIIQSMNQPSSRSSLHEWLHIGSGDSIDINPTPALDLSSPPPTSAILGIPNESPRLLKPINKILVYGGNFLKQRLDEHFHDDHDLNLKYSLDTTDKWIYILGKDLCMLPTVEDVSEYRFNLTAEDSEGLSVSTDLIVSVRQPSKSRLWYYHFGFSIPAFPNWRESIYRNMSQNDHKSFIVRKVFTEANFVYIQYVNETLIDFGKCPISNITEVADAFKKVYPDFHYVLTPGSSICENQRSSNISSNINNYPPSIKNQIDFLNFSNGELYVYKVPDDFCYDPEQGSTSNLNISLVDINHEPLKPDNWLQFDTKNREFFGIYVDGKTGAEVNTANGGVSGGKYILICRDNFGKEASDVLETWVTTAEEQFNAEFSLHFSTNSFNPVQIRKFVEKLSSLFDSSPKQIKIKSYTVDGNIVHFTWYNKSNPGEKEITQLRKVLFSNEGPVDKKVVELFNPDFTITGGNVVPIGKLIGEDTIFHFQNNNNAPGIGTDGGNGLSEGDIDEAINIDSSSYSNYLVTYLIPSVLIAVMVLLSLIIACLLSRKKKLPGEGNEIRKAGGGVPVIFQDELEAEHPLLHSSSGGGNQPTGQPSSSGPSHTPQPPPVHRAASATPPPHKYAHHPPPPGYKSVAKYEPPLPPVQYSSTTNKYHHNSNTGILPPPYVPP
ncbi:unnamed protein product [Allacma fusca]|uniref:Peptidase S72 domain-containing protein n=1 Tax=Allacma fusca TaxID=39272 RepID=A0A8J2JFU8_9HEXA|nr:unnamed protein product [Allacma fusca]